MAQDGGGSAVEREWFAILPSFLKASGAMAADLPDSDKVPVAKGARLRGVLIAEDRDYWVLSRGMLDGRPLPDHIRYIYKGQWQLRALPDVPVPPEPVPVAQPAIGARARLSRRRRFLAFRRRLSDHQGC